MAWNTLDIGSQQAGTAWNTLDIGAQQAVPVAVGGTILPQITAAYMRIFLIIFMVFLV